MDFKQKIKEYFDGLKFNGILSGECSKCDEYFVTKIAWYNFFSYKSLHDLTVHKHHKELHGKGFEIKQLILVYIKALSLSALSILFFVIGVPLVTIIHILTLPFWWICEITQL